MPTNLIAAAVVAVGLIIAAMFGRYEINAHGSGPHVVYRVDRLTGTVETCIPTIAAMEDVPSDAAQPKWCKPSFLPG